MESFVDGLHLLFDAWAGRVEAGRFAEGHVIPHVGAAIWCIDVYANTVAEVLVGSGCKRFSLAARITVGFADKAALICFWIFEAKVDMEARCALGLGGNDEESREALFVVIEL